MKTEARFEQFENYNNFGLSILAFLRAHASGSSGQLFTPFPVLPHMSGSARNATLPLAIAS